MATIPMGNFGQAVAAPAPMARIPRGDPLGEAVQRTGQIAQNIVVDAAAEETKRQREAKDAADRARTLTTLTRTKDRLADLHDEINQGVLDGTVPKDKAESEFEQRHKKVMAEIDPDLPDHVRPMVQAELEGVASRLGNGVRKAVTQRNRQDVTAGISETLEYLQRQYRADPARTTQQAMDTIDQLGPHSTLAPEQLAKMKQAWKEGTQYTTAYELVSAGRNDRKALQAAEKALADGFPDLDPQKRATLTDRIAAYHLHLDQKAELAAQRAQREAERRMRKAEAEFNVFQSLADKGTVLAPEYIDRALQATAGTPYAAGIKQLAQQAAAGASIASQPLRVQQQALDQVNALIAQQGRSPELDKRREQIEKVLRGSQQDVERDPLRAGLERGVITALRPLDMSKGIGGLLPQLQERTPMAERVGLWAGRRVSPLTGEESEQLKAQLDALPPKEKAGAVAMIAQAIGADAAAGLSQQMDQKDAGLKFAFRYANGWTTAGRRVSELILAGQQAKKDGTSTKGEKTPELKVAQWSSHVATELQGLFPSQAVADDMREAALLIAHGLAAEESGQLRTKDLDRAVRFAINGSIAEYNGRRVPLPVGVTEDMLEKRMRTVTAAEIAKQAPEGLVRAGGVPIPVTEFVKTLPAQQLMPLRPGIYTPLVGGRPVINANGDPIAIGVR